MADSTHFVIRGGLEGRERLRVLGRVMRTSSMSLFDRLGLRDGTICLDVGCGGGDATLELARRVAPVGRPRLPALLKQGGFEDVGVAIAQPVGTEGEVKLLNPLTMENIASAVLADGLASQLEIDDVVRELYEFANDPNTVAGTPRVVQAWGRRPTA
jgi:hypothetical protein